VRSVLLPAHAAVWGGVQRAPEGAVLGLQRCARHVHVESVEDVEGTLRSERGTCKGEGTTLGVLVDLMERLHGDCTREAAAWLEQAERAAVRLERVEAYVQPAQLSVRSLVQQREHRL
jgi:hypothetical protein